MNRCQYLLGKLAEECAEVSQMAMKSQQFGLPEIYHVQSLTNAERTHHELDDVMAIIEMLNEEFNFGYLPNSIRIERKKDKVNRYAEYSKSQGLLT